MSSLKRGERVSVDVRGQGLPVARLDGTVQALDARRSLVTVKLDAPLGGRRAVTVATDRVQAHPAAQPGQVDGALADPAAWLPWLRG